MENRFSPLTGEHWNATQMSEPVRLTPEEVQARLTQNQLSLSEENQVAYATLATEPWFITIRALAKHASSIEQWMKSIDRIAAGTGDATDIKKAVFWRSAFNAASKDARTTTQKDAIGAAQIELSRYFCMRLKAQHTHFG